MFLVNQFYLLINHFFQPHMDEKFQNGFLEPFGLPLRAFILSIFTLFIASNVLQSSLISSAGVFVPTLQSLRDIFMSSLVPFNSFVSFS